ncbi:hypothetical protein [Nostoc sp.]|uniref:hypothetical protein n=1 Tax=Nostoc sp. TaxID=1180 RepID=UPI002FF9D56E
MIKQASSITTVDLVMVNDISPSMKDEAQALSNAASAIALIYLNFMLRSLS